MVADDRAEVLAAAWRRRTEAWDKPVGVGELGRFVLEGAGPDLTVAQAEVARLEKECSKEERTEAPLRFRNWFRGYLLG